MVARAAPATEAREVDVLVASDSAPAGCAQCGWLCSGRHLAFAPRVRVSPSPERPTVDIAVGAAVDSAVGAVASRGADSASARHLGFAPRLLRRPTPTLARTEPGTACSGPGPLDTEADLCVPSSAARTVAAAGSAATAAAAAFAGAVAGAGIALVSRHLAFAPRRARYRALCGAPEAVCCALPSTMGRSATRVRMDGLGRRVGRGDLLYVRCRARDR